MRRFVLACCCLLFVARAQAQSLSWTTAATLYGDNTEFFTPYRTGETILGGQFRSYLRMHTGARTEVDLGVFGDHRSGSNQFAHPFQPVISFIYHDTTSTATLGTLVPVRRHGYIEPLEVSTLELTRPIEYGLQWVEKRRWLAVDAYINWQKLNLSNQREVFDYGGVVGVTPAAFITLQAQLHGLHRGGQLHDAGQSVANNAAGAIGVLLHQPRASLALYRAHSHGDVNGVAPVASGSGTYIRGGVLPLKSTEVFAIHWQGSDFNANEGDNNYNSLGKNGTYYRAKREYLEVGVLHRRHIDGPVTLDAELRFHQIDGGIKSVSLFDSRWEYSYRLVVRAPFERVL